VAWRNLTIFGCCRLLWIATSRPMNIWLVFSSLQPSPRRQGPIFGGTTNKMLKQDHESSLGMWEYVTLGRHCAKHLKLYVIHISTYKHTHTHSCTPSLTHATYMYYTKIDNLEESTQSPLLPPLLRPRARNLSPQVVSHNSPWPISVWPRALWSRR